MHVKDRGLTIPVTQNWQVGLYVYAWLKEGDASYSVWLVAVYVHIDESRDCTFLLLHL